MEKEELKENTYKTFYERYGDEILSDNSKVENCKACKDCAFRSDGTVWSNDYKKIHCMIYQYPSHKPMRVIKNKGICEYYHKEENEE